MGQAKLKAVRKPEKEARKGTVRLLSIKVEANFVGYDEHGRAKPEGTGSLEPIFVMESEIPFGIVQAIRAKYPKLEFDFVEPSKPEPPESA